MIYEIKNKKPLKNKFKLHKTSNKTGRIRNSEKTHRNFSKKY